jgi:DNA-binding PadR family transcriptional regulator
MGVREGLLTLLDGEPPYGYQLKIEFETSTGGVWGLNIGQVYTTLDRLARDGHVEAASGDDAGRRT